MEKCTTDTEALGIFAEFYLRRCKPSAAASYTFLRMWAQNKGCTVPSLKTMMRRLRELYPSEAIVLKREGAKGLRRARGKKMFRSPSLPLTFNENPG